MDITTWITPGAQQFAGKMMEQGWNALRDTIARRIGHGKRAESAAAASALDATREKALAAGATGGDEVRLAYCAGFLDALAAVRPDLSDLAHGLHGENASAEPTVNTGNVNTGKADKLVQAHEINGGVRM